MHVQNEQYRMVKIREDDDLNRPGNSDPCMHSTINNETSEIRGLAKFLLYSRKMVASVAAVSEGFYLVYRTRFIQESE